MLIYENSSKVLMIIKFGHTWLFKRPVLMTYMIIATIKQRTIAEYMLTKVEFC